MGVPVTLWLIAFVIIASAMTGCIQRSLRIAQERRDRRARMMTLNASLERMGIDLFALAQAGMSFDRAMSNLKRSMRTK